jgi:hypothetical protein
LSRKTITVTGDLKDPTVVVASESDDTIVDELPDVQVVRVAKPGPQGPPGSGSGVVDPLVFNFNTPSTSWPVAHGLGRDPVAVNVVVAGIDITDTVIVTYVNANNLTVDLGSIPQTGKVVVS